MDIDDDTILNHSGEYEDIRAMVRQLDALLAEQAEYLRETEEGLREWSRSDGHEGCHPVHAANRLRIVRLRMSRKEK